MGTNPQEFLTRVIAAFSFGIIAVILVILSLRRSTRFFYFDYRGNSKEKLKDSLISSLLFALSVVFFIPAILTFQEKNFQWSLIPTSLCIGVLLGAIAIPISILGSYWRSYQANKLWGGFMPFVREKYGYAQPQPVNQNKVDLSKIKIPRRTIFTAVMVAVLVFLGTYFLLFMIGWEESKASGIVLKLLLSGLASFGIFMTIVTSAFSRKIQRIRDGELLDDDDS